MSDTDDQRVNLNRLRWQCRRGMLELDYLLLEFLEQQFPDLERSQQQHFIRLLGQSDQDLQRWLVGGELPRDPGFAALIGRLFSGRCSPFPGGR